MAVWSLFFQPLTTSPSPRIMASKPDARHIGRVVLLRLPDFGVEHVGPFEEVRFGRARHETRDRHARSFSSARNANENESMNALVPL